MSYVKPISEYETMNLLYKHMKMDTSKNYENFNGERTITLFRGEQYMNKITRKLTTDPPMTLIKTMKNLGTEVYPMLKTKAVYFRVPEAQFFFYLKEVGESLKGIYLNLYRMDFEPVRLEYKNFAEMRKDKWFMSVLSKYTKKNLIR